LVVTKLVDFVTRTPDQLSLHFYDFSVIRYKFLKFTAKLWKTCNQTLNQKKKNYNRVLHRPSLPLHLAGGVLLGRAYRGCNGEARWREEFENYLPRVGV